MNRPIASGAALGLVDDHGSVVAANDAFRRWHCGDAEQKLVIDAVRRMQTGKAAAELPVECGAVLRLDRLDGADGSLVLVTLHTVLEPAGSPSVDALTQLPDRRALASRFELFCRAAAPAAPRLALLFLDLDNFKGVNDRHGHGVGDDVLRVLAKRWAACVRDGDLVARYGGDEFVLLLQGAATSAAIEPVVRRLYEATNAPLVVGDLTCEVSVTIGRAIATDAASTLEALIAGADRDMYARKARVLR